jgi:hypothetical protein
LKVDPKVYIRKPSTITLIYLKIFQTWKYFFWIVVDLCLLNEAFIETSRMTVNLKDTLGINLIAKLAISIIDPKGADDAGGRKNVGCYYNTEIVFQTKY